MSHGPHDAFLSYARRDDESGGVTALRAALGRLLGRHLGRPAAIFQDKTGLRWGARWSPALRSALNCPCLIPVVTPHYLESAQCAGELLEFTRFEAEQQAADRILPLYYQTVGAVEVLLGREPKFVQQYAGDQARAFEVLGGRQIRDIRWFSEFSARDFALNETATAELDELAREMAARLTEGRPEPQAEPRATPVIVVPPHESVDAAIHDAGPGSRLILEGPAEHRGSILIDKPLELIAGAQPVVLSGTTGPAITCRAGPVRVAGLSVRSDVHNAALVDRGFAIFERCDIGPSQFSCVLVRDGAEAVLVMCSLHHAHHCGAHVQLGSTCVVADCAIRDNQVGGLFFSQNAGGVVQGNVIENNGVNGVFIAAGANPRICRNWIRHHQSGILVYLHWQEYGPGRGIIEENEIHDSRQFGVQIEQGADPCIRRNTISANAWGGIWIRDGGRGIIHDNRIVNNVGSGIKNEGGQPRLGSNIFDGNGGQPIEDVTGGVIIDDAARCSE